MNPHLLAQSGPIAGQRFELATGVTTLGREAGNTLVIADQTVSRNHARITVAGGVATLEDAGSSGGTFVNEVRLIAPTILKVGDTIRLGGTALSFIPGASVSPMGVTATMPSRSGRRREVGSAEAPQIATPGSSMPLGSSSNPGCMPDFSNMLKDIEGCLPWLLRALIVLVVIVVVVALIGGIILCGVAGAGALGGAAHRGSAGAAGSQGSGGSNSGGGAPPPDEQQQQDKKQTRTADGAIKVISVKATHLTREGFLAPVPVVLVTWQNTGADPVVEVFADITAFDRGGNVIGIQKAVRIYTGPAVPTNSTHADNEQSEGEIIPIDQGKDQSLDHATVTPTEIRVEPAQAPADDD